jgi:glutamate synthase domain-containing protein 2
MTRAGARIFHLVAEPSGRSGGRFIGEVIQEQHRRLVEEGIREEITLIGGGGMLLAEHVPKAILSGLDLVGLDLPLLVALQARFGTTIWLPRLDHDWAVQRIVNLSSSWRDQLLEILGAMGIREVRRLRGELGRCMFQKDLEREAFAGIAGYEG